MTALEQLFTANGIKGVPTEPGRYYTTCPQCSSKRSKAHQPRKVLGVTIEANGKVGWGCNHCNWTGPEKGTKGNGHGSEITYDYRDANGAVAFQKVRGYRDGEKYFRLRQPDGHGDWINNMKGVHSKLIYRRPETDEAIAAGHLIVVAEGEKDCDNLWRVGIAATCNVGGAHKPGQQPKWYREHSEQLRGAHLVIFNDNDPQGRVHAEAVALMSLGIAASVRMLDLSKHWPGMPDKADVSDWLAAGHTREELDQLIQQAPVYEAQQAEQPKTIERFLTLDSWISRVLPKPDCLMGGWLTTTTRSLLYGPTGLGKTMIGLGLAMAAAGGMDFLHWRGVRACKVLFVDGEMSRRLLQQRLVAEANRLGVVPAGFHALSHEDIENFAPLNTPEGQAFIESVIKELGGVDYIMFDNVMSLIAGDQKDEEAWRQTLPWVRSLTRRHIGQTWVHHTGHDETHSYGTKTREWQMDTVIRLEKIENEPGDDLRFKLIFQKARERTPDNRANFADVKIAMIGDQWTCNAAGASKSKPSPMGAKFLDALRNAVVGNETNRMHGCPAATIAMWRAECTGKGLLDPDRPKPASALFSKYRRELIAANCIACNETMAWLVT